MRRRSSKGDVAQNALRVVEQAIQNSPLPNALSVWKSQRFKIDYSLSTMTNDERMQRASSLIATIKQKLPDFAKMCGDESELVMLHQDAFAPTTKRTNTRLLGMAIKYAGLRGKEVRVIGKNRSTLGEEDTIH